MCFFCSSVELADVLEDNCGPVGENELSFMVGICFFHLLVSFGLSACFRLNHIEGKKMWTLIADFPDEMWMLKQPNR